MVRTQTTPEDLVAFDARQRQLHNMEREEALHSVRRGRVLPYCPTAPGKPRKVLLIATEAHVRAVWG